MGDHCAYHHRAARRQLEAGPRVDQQRVPRVLRGETLMPAPLPRVDPRLARLIVRPGPSATVPSGRSATALEPPSPGTVETLPYYLEASSTVSASEVFLAGCCVSPDQARLVPDPRPDFIRGAAQ
ncbi:hypothetical protein TYRP_021427 [Tyrophagus putrescentiae]|nr:hypothetical protein TYRP_021427 [Tyrophagus putrescentiae]